MSFRKLIENNYFVLLFFLFLLILIFRKVITAGGVITQGDYPYFWSFGNPNPFFVWEQSFMGISHLSAMFGKIFLMTIPSILDKLFLPHSLNSYLLNLGPILILTLIVFYAVKKISKNVYFAYFTALFIVLNNYIFAYLVYFPGDSFYGVIALILLFYKTYQIYLNEKISGGDTIKIILYSLLSFHPFFLAMYFLYFVLFTIFYLFQNFSKKSLYKFIFISFFLFILNSYWIIPFLYNLTITAAIDVYRGGGLGPFHAMKLVSNYVNLYRFIYFPLPDLVFSKYNYIPYMFNFLIIAIIPLLFILKPRFNKKDKFLFLFFIFIFLFFFNLALGPNSVLTGDLWSWFMRNVSFFSFFRTFTRFLLLSLVSLIFIFALFIKNWHFKHQNKLIIIFIGLLLTSNAIFFSGDLGGTLLSAKVPKEYFEINETYFQKDLIQNKIVSYPGVHYEENSWNANRLKKIGLYFKQNFFSKPIAFFHTATNLNNKNSLFEKVFASNDNFYFYDEYDKGLDMLNVKYILVQRDLVDILRPEKKVEYEKYISYFSSKTDYQLLRDNEYFALYQNKQYNPLIGGDGVAFQKINPTKYKLYFKNLKQKQKLAFLESNHSEWKLYLKKNPTNSWCKKLRYYKESKTTECKHRQEFFEGEEFFYLYKKPIFDDAHHLVYEYANGWTIDPEYIKQNFSKEYYKENPDGSIDIELTLYFKPQLYFYLGLFISGMTLLGCLGYLGYDWRRRRREIGLASNGYEARAG